MKKRRAFFSPSKDEIWSQIAKDIGGEFIEGGFWGEDVLLYKHGEWQILLDNYTIMMPTGTVTVPVTYTRMRAPFINKDGLYFNIYREGFFSAIRKLFGMQDIKIGDPFFDDQFIIKGNNPEKIKLLLANAKIKQLCQDSYVKNNHIFILRSKMTKVGSVPIFLKVLINCLFNVELSTRLRC